MPHEIEATPRADARRNREAVLNAAIALLSKRPDAPMSEIAKASGLGRTTVYRHFPTREDLIMGLFAVVAQDARAITDGLLQARLEPAELFRELGLRAVVDIGGRYRFLDAFRDMRDRALAQAEAPEADDPMLAYLAEAQRSGRLRDDLPVSWLFAMLRGIITLGVDHMVEGHAGPEEAGRYVGETLVAALCVEDPPR
jgi:AcrR family transcriptional regulator